MIGVTTTVESAQARAAQKTLVNSNCHKEQCGIT
jgi:hypothetical protein